MSFPGESGVFHEPGVGDGDDNAAEIDSDSPSTEGLDPSTAYPQLGAFREHDDPADAFESLSEEDKQKLLDVSREQQENGPHLG